MSTISKTTLLLLIGAVFCFAIFSPQVAQAKPASASSQAESYCKKRYSSKKDQDYCKTGFTSGYNNGNKTSPCLSLKPNLQEPCRSGFSQGADAAAKDGEGYCKRTKCSVGGGGSGGRAQYAMRQSVILLGSM